MSLAAAGSRSRPAHTHTRAEGERDTHTHTTHPVRTRPLEQAQAASRQLAGTQAHKHRAPPDTHLLQRGLVLDVRFLDSLLSHMLQLPSRRLARAHHPCRRLRLLLLMLLAPPLVPCTCGEGAEEATGREMALSGTPGFEGSVAACRTDAEERQSRQTAHTPADDTEQLPAGRCKRACSCPAMTLATSSHHNPRRKARLPLSRASVGVLCTNYKSSWK